MPEAVFIDEGRISRPAARRRRRLSRRGPAKTRGAFTTVSFERFLCWLSEDRDEAGRKYEQMRTKMVRFFTWRGCHIPEELFDRTVDRACRKIDVAAAGRCGNALAFCYAVGRFVLQEYWREVKLDPLPEEVRVAEIQDFERNEHELDRLERCLNGLSPCDRNLITDYYQGEGRERIQKRKELASSTGGSNALRVQVFRIRAKLRKGLSDGAQDCARFTASLSPMLRCSAERGGDAG